MFYIMLNITFITGQQPENVAFYTYLSGKQCYGSHETFIFDVEVNYTTLFSLVTVNLLKKDVLLSVKQHG